MALVQAFLKRKRVAAGLSQKEVADQLEYTTPQFISNWERGVSYPPIETMKKLAGIIKCDPDELFENYLLSYIEDIKVQAKKAFARSTKR